MKKALIITNIPNPYRITLFNELCRQLKEQNIHLKVIFGALSTKRRKFKLDFSEIRFDYKVLNSLKINLGNIEKTFFSYSGILHTINAECPDIIIVSGFSVASSIVWLKSFFRKTDYMIWSGAIEQKGRFDSWIRRLQRRLLIKKASAFIAYGSKAKEYLVSLGADSEKVTISLNTVDTEFFSSQANFLRKTFYEDKNRKHLTYIGYLTKRKNVIRLLKALKELASIRKDFVLDIIGDGDDKINLLKYVEEEGIKENIRFHGFLQKEQLPKFFAISNGFLFQTDFDIWGLVLNEAMASGLPCLSSLNAGATCDLIHEGETGFIIDFNNTSMVVEKINYLLSNPIQAREIGVNAQKFISENASIEFSARKFVKAIIER